MIVPIAITLATLASYAAGWMMGVPLVLPVLNTATSSTAGVAAEPITPGESLAGDPIRLYMREIGQAERCQCPGERWRG